MTLLQSWTVPWGVVDGQRRCYRRYGILHRPVPEFGRLQVVPRLHLNMVGRPVDEAGDGVRRRGDF